jgi:fibronectin type 3 domain-containing protein
MKQFIYIILFCISTLGLNAQETKTRLFVNNSFKPEGGVVLKWLSKDLVSLNGYNVYRKEGSAWTKLNEQPVDVVKGLSRDKFPNDEIFQLYDGIQKSDKGKIKGSFVAVLGLIKAIEYPAMAEAVGITYYDVSADKGNTYEYKVTALNGTTETDFAVSTPFTAGDYTPLSAPKDFQLKRKKNEVILKWKEEKEAYFGNYIYRKKESGDFEKTDDVILIPGGQKQEFIVYNDLNISKDTGYVYKVVGIDFFGQATAFTAELVAPPKAFDVPPAPEMKNPEVQTRLKTINFSWTYPEVSGVEGFNLYQYTDTDDSIGVKMNTDIIPYGTTNTTITLEKEGAFYYRLSAVLNDGTEGFSEPVFAKIHDIFAPAPPEGFTASADTGRVELKWNPSASEDLQEYVIFKALPADTAAKVFLRVGTTKNTNYNETFAPNVKTGYCYYVAATDTHRNSSAPSVLQCVQLPDIKAPRNPVIKSVGIDSTGVIISWIKNVEDDLKGYIIYRKGEKDSAFSRLNISDLDKDQYRYTDRRAKEGEKYYYHIKAIDQSGNLSGGSKPFPIKIPAGATIKEPPYAVQCKYNKEKKQVSVKWKQDFKEGLMGFTVYGGENTDRLAPISGLLQTETFVHPVDGGEPAYYFQVRVYDQNGYSQKSDIIKIEIKQEEQK